MHGCGRGLGVTVPASVAVEGPRDACEQEISVGGLWAPHVPSQQGTIAVLTERLIRGNVHRSGAQASQRQTRPERVRSGRPEVGPENLHF